MPARRAAEWIPQDCWVAAERELVHWLVGGATKGRRGRAGDGAGRYVAGKGRDQLGRDGADGQRVGRWVPILGQGRKGRAQGGKQASQHAT